MCDAIGPRMSAYRDSLAWDAGLGVAYAAYAGVLIFVGGLCRGWITGLGRGCAVEFMVSHVPKAGPFDRLRAGYGAPSSVEDGDFCGGGWGDEWDADGDAAGGV